MSDKSITQSRPTIEHYQSSSEVLHDFFVWRKGKQRGYNFQKLSLDSGLSIGLVNMLINGKKPLREEYVETLGQALGLREREVEFLLKLVSLEQASTVEERTAVLRDLAKRGEFRDHFQVDRGQIEYFSRWYIGVILALVDHPEFEPDPDWIAKTLIPTVTPKEIRLALDTLVDLDLVSITDAGTWQRCDRTIATPDEFASDILKSYHAQRLELSQWGLEHLTTEQRNFGGITAVVDEATFLKIREYMHDVRHTLVDMLNASTPGQPDRVAIINWQTLMVAELAANSDGEQADD